MKFERLRLSWAFIAVVTIIDQVTIRNINLIVRCDRPRYIRDIPSQFATIIRHTFHPIGRLIFHQWQRYQNYIRNISVSLSKCLKLSNY